MNRCRALLVIDNRPLQDAAWAELVRARQRLVKASGEVHRHEVTDEPSFRAWLAATFPTLISAVRTLSEHIEAKTRIVQAVESEAFFTGRSPGQIWREWQRNGGRPSAAPADDAEEEGDMPGRESAADDDAAFDEEMRRFFDDEDVDENDPFAGAFHDAARSFFGFAESRDAAPDAPEARELYRRLVRQLHPDRGGAWTPARARLWEQVQSAWDARDADWLARLEAEWEAAADLLGPTSMISRLRAALKEIDAARRDAERRVRAYRKHVAWRFSLQPPSQKLRAQIHRELQRDESMLRARLEEIEAVMAGWQRAGSRRGARQRRPHPQQFSFGF